MINVKGLTPILNVSDIRKSFAWFETLGWTRRFEWGEPPTFGAVCNGDTEIFLCQNAQGSRSDVMPKFPRDDNTGGVWMSWWVGSPAEVDAAHELALKVGATVTWPPTTEPWGVREFHLRHPDGHTFRVSSGTGENE